MKNVFIAGGSRGIGRACTEIFAANGYNTSFCYEKSDDAAFELSERFGASAYKCDVSDFNAVQKTIDNTCVPDILVYNAGISLCSLITDTSPDAWRKIFAVNVDGAFYFSRAVLPSMIRRKSGCIIFIASMWGETGASCEAAYSASKAALIGFMKSLAKEAGPSGIRVNCISPGVIKTDMLDEFSGEDLDSLIEETPLCRIGTPRDIANTALFLASEASSFITGQVLGVNGGFLI